MSFPQRAEWPAQVATERGGRVRRRGWMCSIQVEEKVKESYVRGLARRTRVSGGLVAL